ncbi:MAG: DNA polymerase I [Synergistaceae bacterium]|jgi:DNA polymerase-1|nr:DNA polymerase I [Synergistaceae bacterium]
MTCGDVRKIMLVDGHGLAFRGFYALPEMNAPDGTPTNAVLGFMNMLLKAVDELRPDGVGLFFDPKGPTARDEMYASYKDGRRPTPEGFKAQIPLIFELCAALGYPVFVRDGVEADDLIAATATAASEDGAEAIILSADKDLLQVLSRDMKMIRPVKGISEFKLYDETSFAEEYGFPPRAMADYLALVGDSVDNIPGVRGIGDKTAKGLIIKYGSLDGVYEAVGSMSGSVRAKLESGRESAYVSYELIVPQNVEAIRPELLRVGQADTAEAARICERLGLKKLMSRLGLNAPEPSAVTECPAPALVRMTEERGVESLMSEDVLVITDNPNVLMAPDGGWSEFQRDVEIEKRLAQWLDGDHRLILADYRRWCEVFPELGGRPEKIFDVELAHYFLHPDAKSHALESILGGWEANGASSAEGILSLWKEYSENGHANDMNRVMREIDAPLTPVLISLQRNGLYADRAALESLEHELGSHIAKIEGEIFAAAGGVINLNSPKQVGNLLFEQLRLPAVKKTKTGLSTDVGVLEDLARLPAPLNEIPLKILEFRECSKMSSGFVHPFIKYSAESPDGRIRSTFLHAVTGTARLASRDPNVQNIPVFGDWAVKFRRAIMPGDPSRPGMVFVAADYSQIELRVLAHLSGEDRLIDAFENDKDVHLETASWVFGLEPGDITPEQRRFAKIVNFGLIYGMRAHGLAQRMGIPRHQAAKLVDRYFSVLPKVSRYIEDSASAAKEAGYTSTIFGRIRPLSEVSTVEGRGNSPIDRVAVNTPIQSAAADIAKIALIRFHRLLERERPESRLVLQVHDSIICEVPQEAADHIESLLTDTMEGVRVLDVPLKAAAKRGYSLADV